jgi:hypothetical protein
MPFTPQNTSFAKEIEFLLMSIVHVTITNMVYGHAGLQGV